MQLVYYKLLKKHAWHCNICMSAMADNLHIVPTAKKRYLLELFAGSKTVSSVAAEEFKYRTFTIDINPKLNPDLSADIGRVRVNQIPESKRIFFLWASVPCHLYSILQFQFSPGLHWKKITYSHRKYYFVPLSSEAIAAIRLLEKTLWLIKHINPVYYIIENPRGILRHMPQMNFAPFLYTVSYNDFGSDLYKPTDLFTNCSFLKLTALKTSVGRQFENTVLNMSDSFSRSVVPPGLVREILKQIDEVHLSAGV